MSILYHQAPPLEVDFQFRALADGSSVFEGYASIFGSRSKPIMDELARGRPYTETINQGAFRRTLGSGRRQSFVVDHNERMMIASSPSGPLRLIEDSKGLHVESPWPRTDYADNVRALYDSGEKLGMSMLFATPKGGDDWPKADTRTVNEAILKHVSVLATMEPAYAGTSATFRALADKLEADVEDLDALFEALREGRALDESQRNLLNRLAAADKPEASAEAAAEAVEPSDDEASRAAMAARFERLAAMEAALPK